MKAREFLSKVAELNSDVEMAIAKIIRKREVDETLKIGKDDNGATCVLYHNKPIRFYKLEDNIDLLEKLEQEENY